MTDKKKTSNVFDFEICIFPLKYLKFVNSSASLVLEFYTGQSPELTTLSISIIESLEKLFICLF